MKAAQAAFKPDAAWRTMDSSTRGELINKLADLIERDAVHIAVINTLTVTSLFTQTILAMDTHIPIQSKPITESNCKFNSC